MFRIEINTHHRFAWTMMKSQDQLICTKQGVSHLLPAQAQTHLAGLEGNARSARQRELFDTEGLIALRCVSPDCRSFPLPRDRKRIS
jgi:DNA helicase-2/ATP-dependent DNA helicase PcrA